MSVVGGILAGGAGLLKAAPGDLDAAFVAGIGAGITPDSYPTFDSGTGAVNAVALQSNGKILAGGSVSKYNNTGALSVLKRLNPDGTLDASFNSGGGGFADSQGQPEINAIVVLADDSILVGGLFTSYNGTARNGILKLNADGTLDAGFAPSGLNPSGLRFVQTIRVQADGKILVGGGFSQLNGTSRQHLGRLNPDGTLDATFAPTGLGLGTALDLAVAPDGKVYVGGASSGGKSFLKRLYADGQVDTSFQPQFGATGGNIGAILLLPDGTILAGGFPTLASAGYNDFLVAYTPQGQINTTFMANMGAGPNGYAGYDLVEAPDGKIIVASRFSAFSGQPRGAIARLNANGSLDATFAPLPYVSDNSFLTHFYCAAVQPDGKIVAGGWLNHVSDPMLETYNLTRFEGDNATGPGTVRWATTLAETPEGQEVRLTAIRYGGTSGAVSVDYASANGSALSGSDYTAATGTFNWANGEGGAMSVVIATLQDTDVEGDHGFTVTLSGAAGGVGIAAGQDVATVTILDDDNDPVFITHPQDTTGIATLSVTLFGAAKHALPVTYLWLKDGSPFVSGSTLTYASLLASNAGTYVLRATIFDPQTNASRSVDSDPAVLTVVEPSGSLDLGWTPGSGFNTTVRQILPLADGSVIVGGAFSTYNGVATPTPYLTKLSAAGLVDAAWPTSETGPNNEMRDMIQLSNGQFMVAGYFTTFNGVNQRGLARLNANGTHDATFVRTTTGNGEVVRVLSDGSILGGFAGLGLRKLSSTGAELASFQPFGSSTTIYDIVVLPGDKILCAAYKSNNPRSVAVYRLNSDLSVDPDFTLATSSASSLTIYDLDVDAEGRIYVAGFFSTMSGVSRSSLARLNPDGTLDETYVPNVGGSLQRIMVQEDGRLLIGGFFTTVDGVSRPRVARLLPDGTLDASFFPGTGPDSTVYALARAATGEIYVGGQFTTFSGQSRGRIARVNGDFGSVQFAQPQAVVNEKSGTVTVKVKRLVGVRGAASVQYQLQGGSAVAGVDFTGTTSGTLTWVDGDATDRDLVFNLTNDGLTNGTRTFTLQLFNAVYPVELGQFSTTTISILDDESTATVLVPPQPVTVPEANSASFSVQVQSATGGSYQWLKGGSEIPLANSATYTIPSVALTDAADYSVRITNGAGPIVSPAAALTVLISPTAVSSGWAPTSPGAANLNGTVRTILPLPDGGALVGGDFTTPQRGIVKIDATGARDAAFTLALDSTFVGAGVHDLLMDGEGRLYIAGRWDSIGGKAYANLIRLRPDGSIDDEFAALLGTGPNGLVRDVSLDSEGRLLIGGSFLRVSNLPSTKGFARLFDYGAVDRTLIARGRSSDACDIYKIEQMPGDTRIYIAGSVNNYSSLNYVGRITAEGARDFSFNPSGVNQRVSDFITDASGGIVIAGAFTGTPAYLSRYLPAGGLDSTFLAGVTINGVVNSLARQPNGRIAVGGAFTSFGSSANRFARVTPEGAVDGTLNLGTGFGGEVFKVVAGNDGRLWVGGSFTQYKGAAANYLVRLHGDDVETGITGQPKPQRVSAGSTATFSATTAGTGTPVFQWFKGSTPMTNGGNVSGADSATLQISNAQLADEGIYRLRVTAGSTVVDSLSVELKILGAPVVVQATTGGEYPVGRRLVLGADVLGEGPLSFQWKKGTADVPLANSRVLVLTNPTAADSGTYTLEMTNGFGTVPSAPMDITFTDPAPAGIRAIPLASGGANGSVIFPIPDGRFFVGYGATSLRLYDQSGVETTIPSFNGRVDWVIRQANGGYLIAGQFTQVGGQPAKWLARLNANFTHDTTFQANLGTFNGAGGFAGVRRVIELPNGRIVAAGGFSDLNGEAGTQGIVMLRPNGMRDGAFVSGANQAPTVYGLLFDAADNSLLVGAFTFGYAGVNSQIHRLGLDGARDGSLMVTTDNTLRAMALQADRKIVVGGDFTSVQGVARLGLARLHPDGTLDASFTAQSAILATNTVGDVKTIALEADGDIVVAGGFVAMGGIGQNLIARLSPDGSVDTRFDAGFGLAGNGSRAESVAIGQDGSIFLTGSILSYDDTTINDVVVLNGDRVPLAFAARPFAVDVAPGGSIVLRATGVGTSAVGYRWLNNGVPLSNGGDISGATSDTLTIANADLTDADTYTVEITNLSGTLAADAVVTVLGAPLIREDPLGGTFAVSSTINLHVEVVGVPTLVYEWYVGGTQLTNGGNVSGADTATLTLTNVQKADSGSYTVKVTNGQGFDESAAAVVNVILPPAGFYAGFPVAAGANTRIRAVLPSDGDQVFIGGAFSLAGPTGFNTSAVRFALLKNDGTVDTSVSSLSPNSDVYDLAYHGTDGLLIGGGFTTIGGASRAYLARFTALGPDTTFNTNLGTGPNSTVLQVLVQPDDKVLVAGYFSSASGATRYGIARYNADGTLDTDFNPSMPNFAQVNAMALGANGKITISGFFNLSGRQNIARLNGNGTLDTTFNATLDSAAQSLILQPDGKVIAGGYFGTVNGQAGFGTLARLNVNGSTDSGFPAAGPFSGTINTMAIQSNERILVGGNFTGYGGSGAGLVRLEPNGLVDSTFATGTGWPSFADVHDIVIRDDGVIWVGANGIQFNGQTVNYLAAFNGDEPAVGTTFASWVIANMLPAGKDGPLDDVDLDGVSNLLEYALGLDPKISDANGMPQAVEAAGQLTLTYRQIRTDVTYSAETTTDLANPASWSVIGVDQGSPGPDGTTTASIPISGLNGFLRVKVVQIP